MYIVYAGGWELIFNSVEFPNHGKFLLLHLLVLNWLPSHPYATEVSVNFGKHIDKSYHTFLLIFSRNICSLPNSSFHANPSCSFFFCNLSQAGSQFLGWSSRLTLSLYYRCKLFDNYIINNILSSCPFLYGAFKSEVGIHMWKRLCVVILTFLRGDSWGKENSKKRRKKPPTLHNDKNIALVI